MDPYLAAIAAAAERGEECEPLWLTLASGDLITGVPAPARAYIDATYHALLDRFNRGGRTQARRQASQSAAADAAREVIASVNINLAPGYVETITLTNAKVVWGGRGDGADLPAVRVNLSTVALWWMAGGKPFRAPASFFGGVVVPIGQQ